jgi:hypothetical protein
MMTRLFLSSRRLYFGDNISKVLLLIINANFSPVKIKSFTSTSLYITDNKLINTKSYLYIL